MHNTTSDLHPSDSQGKFFDLLQRMKWKKKIEMLKNSDEMG